MDEEEKTEEEKIVEKKVEDNFKSRLLRRLAEVGLFFLELVKVAVLAAITIVLIRHFLFKPFYVRGASMEPNFFNKEYLIIDELSYRLRDIKRGEVIVFKYPDNTKEYFLKRIVGLPGERIKISNGKVIIYNQQYPEGMTLQESYIDDSVNTSGDETLTLKDDQYFVLGDNRPNSFDSRRFGAVDDSYIVGRAIFRGWPISRVEIIHSPLFTNN